MAPHSFLKSEVINPETIETISTGKNVDNYKLPSFNANKIMFRDFRCIASNYYFKIFADDSQLALIRQFLLNYLPLK